MSVVINIGGFQGVKSIKLDEIDNYDDVCIIATGNSSWADAKLMFEKS